MKRSSRKKRLVKWSKLGLSLAAVTVLGGVVEPGVADFVSPKVYAETYVNTSDQLIGVVIWHFAENTDGSSFRLNGDGGYMEVQPGQEIRSSAPNYDGYTLSHTSYAPPAWDGGDGILSFVYKQNKIAEQPVSTEKPAGDANSSDTSAVSQPAETSDVIPTDTPIAPLTDSSTGNDIVNSTIQLVDQDGEILQTIQQSGAEGSEVRFEFPVISGYRVGKVEGFDGWTFMKDGTFRLAANKIVKVYYDKAPSIDALIRPEQRVEYQKVFDEFHNTILKAFEVYKKELGVDDITYEANDLEKIFADSNLSVLHSELVLEQRLFAKPVGLVLTDQDIINAIGWTPEYWDYQIAYHKEITQKLEKAMANIAASKAIPTVPVDQSITIKAVYTEEQIEPGQKVDVLKEIEYTLKPGESVVLEPLTFEGWTSRVVQESQTVTYEEAKARPNKEYYFYYIEEGTTPTEKPIETPAETPTEKPAEQLVEKPTEQPVEKLVERPTASPTGQSASEKQATKQGDKEPAAPASQSKQSTVKPASTSQSQAKTLPATGEASSVLHLTGLGLLGLAGLVVKRRSGKSS
ncbi:LPXTG cell wall anchor domain-containing protein [Streptococcus suis]|uniref:LPXTG cell wall anchor domain-containing protein n=1 Tax=Streptococcus suis TaxID=1307 RepID=UPI000CF5B0CE|nr:LPXTG cell wall anchor domain-containing protein [Streptococcus suis]